MSIQQGTVDLAVFQRPPLVLEAVDQRTVFEMELALTKACEILPRHLDTHENRCFIAKKILKRVSSGERTYGGFVCAGMAAVEELRQLREQV